MITTLSDLLEGARKRRTAYRSGRRELVGFELPQQIKKSLSTKKKKRDKPGRLIARTPFASRQRWRIY